MLQQLKTILGCLAQPAFVRDQTGICLVNQAAADLALPQDAETLLAQLPPLDGGSGQGMVSFRGTAWEAAIRPVEVGQLVLLQPQRELEPQILAAAASALREPLQRMLLESKKLWPRLESQEDEKIQAETAAINRSMYQMLRAVGNLSDFEPSQMPICHFRDRVLCNDFLEVFAQRVQPLVETTGRVFTLQCQQRRFYALIDVAAVERALLNLIANAIAYSPTGSTVTIRAFADGKRCCFAVENTGEVITEDALAGIFAGYTQDALHRQGAGFGLQIARNTAQAHEGSLMISPKPEGGLTVVLSVEAAELRFGESAVYSPVKLERTGGFDRYLVELSGVLEDTWFDTRKID